MCQIPDPHVRRQLPYEPPHVPGGHVAHARSQIAICHVANGRLGFAMWQMANGDLGVGVGVDLSSGVAVAGGS